MKSLKPRSVSQLNSYEKCPMAYKLERIDKAWKRPAAWFAQGLAVHAGAEHWEKSGRTMTLEEVQAIYTEEFDKEINKALETARNPNFWFRSGRYGAVQDIPRRYDIGLEQVEKYINWYQDHPEETPWVTPASYDPLCMGKTEHVSDCQCQLPQRAIELKFDVDLDGVQVIGFIDAAMEVPDPDREGRSMIIVRDNKTGTSPGDDFQLGVYGVALTLMYGIEPPRFGDYWMGRTGKPTHPYKISEWTVEAVTEKFHELEENLQAERFDPKPSPKACGFCSVSLSCDFSMA